MYVDYDSDGNPILDHDPEGNTIIILPAEVPKGDENDDEEDE